MMVSVDSVWAEKALIRLRRCSGLSGPLLLSDDTFLHDEAHVIKCSLIMNHIIQGF